MSQSDEAVEQLTSAVSEHAKRGKTVRLAGARAD